MTSVLMGAAIVLGGVLGAAIAGPAAAHPHVFIDSKAGFSFDAEGQLAALRITWVYDAFTSLTLLDQLDLDQDNDGILNAADLARLVQAQTIWPEDFNGDTHLESAGQPIALGRPVNGAAEMTGGRIAVSFELPVEAPFEPVAPVELRLYDPSYYYAYSTVWLDAAEPEACAATVAPFQADQATSALQSQLSRLSQEETPEQDGVGRLFADVIRLTCD